MTLEAVLHRELYKAMSRNLDFAPQPEDLPATHAVMLEDLKRYGLADDDADRLQRAFWKVGRESDRFPTPSMILRALPAPPMLAKPTGHGFVNRQGLRKFVDLARPLVDDMAPPPPDTNDEETTQ